MHVQSCSLAGSEHYEIQCGALVARNWPGWGGDWRLELGRGSRKNSMTSKKFMMCRSPVFSVWIRWWKKFPQIMYFSAYDFTYEIIDMNSILISVTVTYFFSEFLARMFSNWQRWPIKYPVPLAKSTTSSVCPQGTSHSSKPAYLCMFNLSVAS